MAHNYRIRVYFSHTYSDVVISANSEADARRIAVAQYHGCQVSNTVVRIRD